MWAVYSFREQHGLENGEVYGVSKGCFFTNSGYYCEGEKVYEIEFLECSQNTRDLGNIYWLYARQDFYFNERVEASYPFLDRVVAWMTPSDI